MEHFLRQLHAIPEVAELIRRVEEGGCPAAVSGLQPVQRACVGAAVAAAADRPAVFVCGDEREARQLSADLETLSGVKPVCCCAGSGSCGLWPLLPASGSRGGWRRCMLLPAARRRSW